MNLVVKVVYHVDARGVAVGLPPEWTDGVCELIMANQEHSGQQDREVVPIESRGSLERHKSVLPTESIQVNHEI